MEGVRLTTGGIIVAACASLVFTSCSQPSQSSPPPAALYEGEAGRRTPYDARYERVRQYMQELREKVRYQPEPEGKDYWQLPEESERLGTGDCEDFAIWLYAKMKREGVNNVRLCIGKFHSDADQMHAWVLWFTEGRTFILDPSVHREPVCTRTIDTGRYIPHYSYDVDARWIHAPAGR